MASRALLTRWPAWRFESGRCQETLKKHFQVASLDGFGLRGMNLAVRAAGALLQYLEETQPAALEAAERALHLFSLSEFMTLDAATRRNLELTETIRQGEVQGSLLSVLDHTVTAMGKRLMRQWVSKPLLDLHAIKRRQDGVAYFVEHGMLRAELRAALRSLADLERLTNRIISGHALPRDLTAIRSTLRLACPKSWRCFPSHLLRSKAILGSIHTNARPNLACWKPPSREDPPATLHNTGIIRPGFSAELDHIIEASRHAREWIANLEAIERERTGIKTLKVGYNKVFGYYIEITHGNSRQRARPITSASRPW